MAKTEQKVQTCTAAERKAAYQEVYCSHRNPEWSSANSGKDYVRPYKKTKSRANGRNSSLNKLAKNKKKLRTKVRRSNSCCSIEQRCL